MAPAQSADVQSRVCFHLALIYLAAFASILVQSRGLYGDHGVLPIRTLPEFSSSTRSPAPSSIREFFSLSPPTLLRFYTALQLRPIDMFDLICLCGIIIAFRCVISIGALSGWLAVLHFAALWLLYLSLFAVGQTFLWFQWDTLLLEFGFLCVFVASRMRPPRYSSEEEEQQDEHDEEEDENEKEEEKERRVERDLDALAMFPVKWLFFRFMFSSGVVKLTSGCPAWWGLTALNWHYQSQCIPTFAAWFAHQLPDWLHRLSVVATFVIEIPVPFLFFSPNRTLCRVAQYLQVLLQVLIILTGNYNFFNYATLALCLSLSPMETSLTEKKRAALEMRIKDSPKIGVFTRLANFFSYLINHRVIAGSVLIGLLVATVRLFNLQLILTNDAFSISSNIAFSNEEFLEFLYYAVELSVMLGFLALCVALFRPITSLISSLFVLFIRKNAQKLHRRVFSLLCNLCNYAILFAFASLIYFASLSPYTLSLDRRVARNLPAVTHNLYSRVSHLEILHSYGLFRSMTGVGGRPELVIEANWGENAGQNEKSAAWIPYEFRYKPGCLTRMPPFLVPHQPRLDWQMWFAALASSYQETPWLLNLVARLLMNEKDALELLASPPFPPLLSNSAPKFIRIRRFTYHFTDASFVDASSNSSTNWWRRSDPEEFLPAISLDHDGFRRYLEENDLIMPHRSSSKSEKVGGGLLADAIEWLRHGAGRKYVTSQEFAHWFVWACIALALASRHVSKRLFASNRPLHDRTIAFN